jgi:hypothetical protein
MNIENISQKKLGQHIAVGDTVRVCVKGNMVLRTVAKITGQSCAGSWSEMRGEGFPTVEYTDGSSDMLCRDIAYTLA